MNDGQRAKLAQLGQAYLDAIYEDKVFHEKNAGVRDKLVEKLGDMEDAGLDIGDAHVASAGLGAEDFRMVLQFAMEDTAIHERVDRARTEYLTARSLFDISDDVGITADEQEAFSGAVRAFDLQDPEEREI